MTAVAKISPQVRREWTTREVKIVQANFPAGGIVACRALLPDRSDSSIYQHARKLGLKAPKTKGPRQRWETSDRIDDFIRRVYSTDKLGYGVVRDAAHTLGRPVWWVKKRAALLGLSTPRFKQPEWSAEELAVIERSVSKHPETIRRALKRAGFARSTTAIIVKMKRLDVDRTDYDHFTASALAKVMGVDSKVVTGWISKGWLKAQRRGTDRTEAQGGDQWWIHQKDVRRFIIENVAAVDFKKLDKYWLVDLLTEKAKGE